MSDNVLEIVSPAKFPVVDVTCVYTHKIHMQIQGAIKCFQVIPVRVEMRVCPGAAGTNRVSVDQGWSMRPERLASQSDLSPSFRILDVIALTF